MRKFRVFAFLFGLFTLLYTVAKVVDAEVVPSAAHSRSLLQGPVDENSRVTLHGNVRPEVQRDHDGGAVAASLPLQHMWLQLKRAPEQQAALDSLVERLQTPGNALYHQWLTPVEFGQTFGVAPSDLSEITTWLQSHGMTVNHVYANGILIDFSGTAGAVTAAFHTEIHSLVNKKGETHFANMTDPQIPSALAPVVSGVVRLHDFAPHAMAIPAGTASRNSATGEVRRWQPGGSASGIGISGTNSGTGPKSDFSTTCPASDCNYAQLLNIVGPFDFATIYNTLPLLSGNSAVTGKGQTIVMLEDSDLQAADVTTFRSAFLPPGYTGTWKAVHPTGANNCADPGKTSDEIEAAVDAEWAGAVAPNAMVETASCTSTNVAFGGLIALENMLNTAGAPAIYGLSYGECESTLGYAQAAAINAAYQQAAAQGASIYVATGNAGSAECDGEGAGYATSGMSVNGFASTPYNVAVGGTDFSDTYAGTTSTYWSADDSVLYESAKSYIPEVPWNDSCGGELNFGHQGYADGDNFCNSSNGERSFLTVAATGGGASALYAKPGFQAGAGVQNDGLRDIPDISLFAAGGIWGHSLAYCMSDVQQGGVQCGYGDTQQLLFNLGGGTGFASSAMAGVQALINQKTGEAQGNPNYILYSLAQSNGTGGSSACNSSLGTGESASCIFHDVTLGDNSVPCFTGSVNCMSGSTEQSYGVLSADSATASYQATTGWDFASGIGTPNIANLVNAWSTMSMGAPTVTVAVTPGSALPGQAVAVSVTVSGKGSYPTGAVDLTVSDVAGTLGSVALPMVPATAPNCSATCQNGVSLNVTLPGNLPTGAYTLTATYKTAGEQYAAATGTTDLHVVSNTTTLSMVAGSSLNQGQLDVDLALTWTGSRQPTGSIVIQSAGSAAPIATLLLPNQGCAVTAGSISCSGVPLNFPAPASYRMTASYTGDTVYAASSSATVSYTVAGLSATLSGLTITPATITPGNPTPVFSVTVFGSSAAQPSGTVTLSGNYGLNQFASMPLAACQTVSNLAKVCTIPYKNMWDLWGNNVYSVTAKFTGSGLYNGTVVTTGPQTLVIAGGNASSTSITLSAGGNYAVGSTVTATLVSTGAGGQGHPTGTIAISPFGLGLPVSLGLPSNCAVTNSYTYTCTLSFVIPTSAAPGSYSVIASYPGDANYNPSVATAALFVMPSINFSSANHNFGTVVVGQVATYGVQVTNNMTAAFPFNVQLTGDAEFTLSNGCPSTIAAGMSCELIFSYKPTAGGTATANWSVGGGAGITFLPSDGGVLTGTGSVTQQVTLTSAGHNWGIQDMGSVSQVYGTVLTNATVDPLAVTITLSGDTGDFHTYAINCGNSLPANASCNLQYQFTPQTTGAKQELVNISLTDTVTGQTVSILSGGGVVQGLTLSGRGQ